MKKITRLLSLALAGIMMLALLAACSSTEAAEAPAQTTEQTPAEQPAQTAAAPAGDQSAPAEVELPVTKVTVAYSAASRPMNFTNDAGEADGYEVQVMKAIDAELPQYEFEFVAIPDDADLLIGVETGKYDVGIKAAWVTEERLQKYIFPQHPNGASSIGLVYRVTDKELYGETLEGFAAAGGRLIPISPISAQYSVIEDFNAKHPDTPIELEASETFDVADAYRWVLEGRYDGYFSVKTWYLNTIKNEGAPYHEYDPDMDYFVYKSLPVWPLFNRSQQELADAYDEALLKVLESGQINEIMFKYLDENTFAYLDDEYQYLKP